MSAVLRTRSAFDLDDDRAYVAWRDTKLADRPRSVDELVVEDRKSVV